jgi:hypothetical protein
VNLDSFFRHGILALFCLSAPIFAQPIAHFAGQSSLAVVLDPSTNAINKDSSANFEITGEPARLLFDILAAKFKPYGNTKVSVVSSKEFTCTLSVQTQRAECSFYLASSGKLLPVEPGIAGVGN